MKSTILIGVSISLYITILFMATASLFINGINLNAPAAVLAHIGLIPTTLTLILATQLNFPKVLPAPVKRIADYLDTDSAVNTI